MFVNALKPNILLRLAIYKPTYLSFGREAQNQRFSMAPWNHLIRPIREVISSQASSLCQNNLTSSSSTYSERTWGNGRTWGMAFLGRCKVMSLLAKFLLFGNETFQVEIPFKMEDVTGKPSIDKGGNIFSGRFIYCWRGWAQNQVISGPGTFVPETWKGTSQTSGLSIDGQNRLLQLWWWILVLSTSECGHIIRNKFLETQRAKTRDGNYNVGPPR